MIKKQGNEFLLCGKDYAYAMRVTQTRFLQHLHFGGKISESDLAALSALAESSAPQADDLNKDMKLNGMQSEYGFYAHGDFHDPTAIFERGDGAAMTRLRYVSSEIVKSAPKIDGMPHVRTADETLVITLKDDFSDVEVVLYYAVCENANVLARHAVIRNTGKEAVTLKKRSLSVWICRGESIKLCASAVCGDRNAFRALRPSDTASREYSRSTADPRTRRIRFWEFWEKGAKKKRGIATAFSSFTAGILQSRQNGVKSDRCVCRAAYAT